MNAARNNLAMFCSVEDGIDHQRHRRRNEDAQRAADRQGRRGQATGVVESAHFRQRHLRQRCGGRNRRAAHRAEHGARDDRGHRHAAAKMSDQRIGELEQRSAQPALRGELSHQNEQRNHRQVVQREARVGRALQVIDQTAIARQIPVAHRAGQKHRDRDRARAAPSARSCRRTGRSASAVLLTAGARLDSVHAAAAL